MISSSFCGRLLTHSSFFKISKSSFDNSITGRNCTPLRRVSKMDHGKLFSASFATSGVPTKDDGHSYSHEHDVFWFRKKFEDEWRSLNEELVKGVVPSASEFNHFLFYHEGKGSAREMVNILKIMKKYGRRIDIQSCNIVIRQLGKRDLRDVDDMLKEMRRQKIYPDEQTHHIISKRVISLASTRTPGLLEYFKKEREKDLENLQKK